MARISRRIGRWVCASAAAGLLALAASAGVASPAEAGNGLPTPRAEHDRDTATPVKHVIILIGENRGTDHTFGVYRPKGAGQTISNILSKGIVQEDGSPGPRFKLAQQYAVSPQPLYYVAAPRSAKTPYGSTGQMPQPNTNGAPIAPSLTAPPFPPQLVAEIPFIDPTPDVNTYTQVILTTGYTSLPANSLDTRVPGAGTLPNGPFVLQGPSLSDDDYTGDQTHRFYQAWQQSDCSISNATRENPSGCLNDLFPFVMSTNDLDDSQTPPVQGDYSEGDEMGFYDSLTGEAAILTELADRFTLSDNFHQSFQGGTGANHFMIGTGDAGFWSDGNGHAITPPANEIANPNPAPGTTNKYIADNNFTECADSTQPGVAAIVGYLRTLPYHAAPHCEPGHYYMLDNTNPGFLPNGYQLPDPGALGAIPASSVRTIGDDLNDGHVSWAYFGGSYNDAVALSNDAVTAGTASETPEALVLAALSDPAHELGIAYCQICNPFQYAASIMGDPAQRAAHIKDTTDLLAEIQDGTLPAVSFGKPDGLLDGHPETSKVDLFEAYVHQVLDALEANPALKAETVVFVTWDEAGGYWDSGYIQPIDFFGDGPRIPLLVLSPWSTGGKIDHTYGDHASLLKFIERNWHLPPVSPRSRDNLPDPVQRPDAPYVPANLPALSDLFDLFDFRHPVTQSYLP